MKKRVAILISGGGSNMTALLDDMDADHPAEPVLVLSNTSKAGGLEKAAERGVATAVIDHRKFATREAFDKKLREAIKAANVEIICLAGFMRILTADFVTAHKRRILNIHPSLLPKYKGLNTHARALAAGDKTHGCSVHLVTPALDDGPVLGQASLQIVPGDRPETLAARVLELEHRLYPLVLRRFACGDTAPLFLP